MKYLIRRFYAREDHPDNRRIIKTNLTLKQAREYCSRDDTHKPGAWFDGFEEQEVKYENK